MSPRPDFDPLQWNGVTAVCAHPDDESFGLGGIIALLVRSGVRVDLACLTQGEASTLGSSQQLAVERTRELRCASDVLGIHHFELFDHPDGELESISVELLADDISRTLSGPCDVILTFDSHGITGHPDHVQATRAAVLAGRRAGIPVLAWALPEGVARQLVREFGIPFVGQRLDLLEVSILVDRQVQAAAMRCHGSQLSENPVPQRRIDLTGDHEYLRWLHIP